MTQSNDDEMNIKQVTVFTAGDSSKLSTWSNVPYFFTQTLLAKNIKVNRVDLSPGFWGKVINRTVWRSVLLFNARSTYDYSRSVMHERTVKRRIGRAVKVYASADANVFLTFSFSSVGLSSHPVVLFGDWTYEHLLRHFHGREPDYLEQQAIAREDMAIESADWVFALFPSVAEHMKRRYRNKHIFYAGNVVNSLLHVQPTDVVSRKLKSRDLLFIGSKKYQAGAQQLLEAYSILKPRYPGLSVSIIGMKDGDLGRLPQGVQCFGYLDKGNDVERDLYYSLLLGARAIVNTTPKWGAFSAMLEAMYFYNPVVVTPYEEFVQTFGQQLGFGLYCADNSMDTLCRCLEDLLGDDGYQQRCVNAHEAVRDYTWSAYIDRLLRRISGTTTDATDRLADGGVSV